MKVLLMRCIFVIFVLLLGAASVQADDQTTRVQQALTQEGFYNGTVDGKLGEETRAALRRYQIRNGLDVSGGISPETLSSLKIKPSRDAVAARVVEREIVAEKPRVESVKPVREITSARSPVSDFFAESELANKPARVQSQTLVEAQSQLLRLGYYRSAPDGLPGPETEMALLKFQHANGLRKTGRLDPDTVEALYDAPRPVAAKPFRSPGKRPAGQVYRGVWVR